MSLINFDKLIEKYDVPCPRYTSYPTVPYWNNQISESTQWEHVLSEQIVKSIHQEVSIYIHLPFCESLCTYCGCNTRITKNHKVEMPYIRTLLREWELYKAIFNKKPILKELHLGGGTPTFFSPQHLHYLLTSLLAEFEITPDTSMGFEAHPANTTEEHLHVLYVLGFRKISIGIQDLDENVQRIINRKQTFEQIEKLSCKSRNIGYTCINYDLIYGLPLQTIEGVKNTIARILSLRPDRLAFYSYAHVPWLKPAQKIFTDEMLPSKTEKRKLYETGRQLFHAAGYFEIGMDHFALPHDELYKASICGTLHRNFMGYTPHYSPLLIGLGASSISDIWTAFMQNHKEVEVYMEKIHQGNFAIHRSHIHNSQDLYLRKQIQNIMCRYETTFNEDDVSRELQTSLLKNLEPYQSDELVEIHQNHVKVTDIGKIFLRNICSAFDLRMSEAKNQKVLFSKAI
ncbi:MAG: oxygen-independent coproporphyrinogen III oxidase [Cytophagaceae bacterium]|nr:oxygen-independent coproporphyrinogen III oxidase [Cytophagaceae bacterium]MDW8456132.1 oxygen-independent coproporphyrinogen III oxidase [Cytophagaceae bacterium]